MRPNRYYFDAKSAALILNAFKDGKNEILLSTDLNRSEKIFPLVGDNLILDEMNRINRLEFIEIQHKDSRIFMLEEGKLELLEIRGDGYYKLVPTEQAPLLEISGVKMHISKGISPYESAALMAAQVVKKGDRILDTCSGLGYAATAAVKLGSREVITVEISATVMALRQKNPWSADLSSPVISAVHGDINDLICDYESESFDAIIHDPPRFSLAGELYSEKFYREIFRVLKRRGSLFHYTGNPQLLKRGSNFMDHAIQRLRAAGFRRVVKVPGLMGVTATKQ